MSKRAGMVVMAAAVSTTLAAPYVSAQTQVQTTLSATTVEVGQSVRLQAQAMGSDTAPDNPRLTAPNGFVVNGPSIGTNQQISITNGGLRRLSGITATWRITPTKVGTFTIGPVSVNTPQGRVKGQRVQLKVVPAGTLPAPPRRKRRGFPFGGAGPGRSLFDDLFGVPRDTPPPEAPAEFRMQRAPDSTAFVRTKLSHKQAVVGQQITLTVYAYGARGRFIESNTREPRHPDFEAIPLQERQRSPETHEVVIGGRRYLATKLREVALFPLKPGRLTIGELTTHFYGNGYVNNSSPEGLERKTKALTVDVVAAPAAGRPTGYETGNVGRFSLKAELNPHKVKEGEAVGVVVTLEGQGKLPSRLNTPDQKGIEWLAPTLKERIGVRRDGTIGGSRTFTFVLRASKAGKYNLGEISLPHFSPRSGRYHIARANLGTLEVTPAAKGAQGQPTRQAGAAQGLSEELAVRKALAPTRTPPLQLGRQGWFWSAVFLIPLAAQLQQSLSGWSLEWLRRRRLRKASPQHQAQAALKAASEALKAGQDQEHLSALERAIHHGVESSCGVRSRAVVREDLVSTLAAAQLPKRTAEQVSSILEELDLKRFSGAGRDAPAIHGATQQLVHLLCRSSHGPRGEQS